MSDTILVVDDEPDLLRFLEVNLRLRGFDVLSAADGAEGLALALSRRPDLIVLDVTLPDPDGIEVTRRLRADQRTAGTPIILITARSEIADKVAGLAAGADDYLLKPFDPVELVARIAVTLQRSRDLRATSPLTGLPGNHRIEGELARRLAEGADLALVYADLNDFKSYNDRYGFLRGDAVIQLTVDVLQRALAEHAPPGWFLGHIGGDDFSFICAPAAVPAVCEHAIDDFDRRIADCYDEADRAAGHLELPDRQGNLQRFPLVSIALGVATTERREYDDHRELVAVATEMKGYVKRLRAGSRYAVDSRTDDDAGAEAGAAVDRGGRAPR